MHSFARGFEQRRGEHMRNKVLVVGFALISAFAVAQAGNSKTDAAASTDPKQGQAKAKVPPEKIEAGSENIKKNGGVQIKPTNASPMASDDWNRSEERRVGK